MEISDRTRLAISNITNVQIDERRTYVLAMQNSSGRLFCLPCRRILQQGWSGPHLCSSETGGIVAGSMVRRGVMDEEAVVAFETGGDFELLSFLFSRRRAKTSSIATTPSDSRTHTKLRRSRLPPLSGEGGDMTGFRRALVALAQRAACTEASASQGVRSLRTEFRRLAPNGAVRWRSATCGEASTAYGFGTGTRVSSHETCVNERSVSLFHSQRPNNWSATRGVATSRCLFGADGVSNLDADAVVDAPSTSTKSPQSTAVDISDSTDPSTRFYGAQSDYAGVTVRSSINWPLPLDEIAKLNPKLALAMGASEKRVAESNKNRPAIDPVLSGRGRGGMYGGVSYGSGPSNTQLTNNKDSLFQGIDLNTCEPEELAVLQILARDELDDDSLKASELDRARFKRDEEKQSELIKKQAQLAGRKNAPYAKRVSGDEKVQRAKSAAEEEKVKISLEQEKKDLLGAWTKAKESNSFHSVLPKPGSKPGVTPRVYNVLKQQLLKKADRQTMAKHVSADLTSAALRRLKVIDLRKACDVLGVPSIGDKQLCVEMLKAHFDDAEVTFAREFISKIQGLDKEVAAAKKEAARLARLEAKSDGNSTSDEPGAEKLSAAMTVEAAAAAGASMRDTGQKRIGERATARAARAAQRLRGWDDDDESDDSLQSSVGGDLDFEEEDDDSEIDDDAKYDEEDEDASENDLTPTSTGRMKYANAFWPDELVDLLLKAKGSDIVCIPVSEKCGWADYFVVATARSPRHIRMLAGSVLHAVKQRVKYVLGTSLRPSIEGADSIETGEEGDDHWMLVDCGSCVVHVFSSEARRRYDLEGLWAPGIELEKVNGDPSSVPMTIDTIQNDSDDSDSSETEHSYEASDGLSIDGLEIDMESMGDLDEYDDEYLDPPDWDVSLTDLEERKVANVKKNAGTKGFGEKGVRLDDK